MLPILRTGLARMIYSLSEIMGSNAILTAELLHQQDIIISKTVRLTCNMSEYPAKIPTPRVV